jgi:deazaflavin-dependent oxidoreductase (nitroreductase family)
MKATEFNQRTIDEFHARNGRGIGPFGDNLLLMTAKGAVSGDEITTPVVYRRVGNDYVIVASNGGAPDSPHWYRNIQVNPVVDIETAGEEGIERFQAQARAVPGGDERDRLYANMTEVWPAFADYAGKTARVIPVVVLKRLGASTP